MNNIKSVIVGFLRKIIFLFSKGGNIMSQVEKMNVPEVHITAEAMKKLGRIIDLCPQEVTGFGRMKFENNIILITNIYLLPQRVSAASASISVDDVAHFMEEYDSRGEPMRELRVWWHSHASFGIHWSGVDQSTSEIFKTDMVVGILGNHEQKYTCWIDVYQPFRIKIGNLPLICPELEEYDRNLRQEIEEKVLSYQSFEKNN